VIQAKMVDRHIRLFGRPNCLAVHRYWNSSRSDLASHLTLLISFSEFLPIAGMNGMVRARERES
jgi:hypothetical protein